MGKKEVHHIVIVGGGPGGYEAASSAARLGAKVTLIERQGIGGAAVLTDVVPSKTLIAASESLAYHDENQTPDLGDVTLAHINEKIRRLSQSQSNDLRQGLDSLGVRLIHGEGKVVAPHYVEAIDHTGQSERIFADYILLAVGAKPRELESLKPDGKRIFTWTQLYEMTELPEKLIVIGSGVTGAEFASAYTNLGVKVTLISSREHVLPGEDSDAAQVLENAFTHKGMEVLSVSRAERVSAFDHGVTVRLTDGQEIQGSHCLVAVGAVPNTATIGLENCGINLNTQGHIEVDGVSRTSVPYIYAAGDCTGILPLASVAAMQGRIAIAHIMGDTVQPLNLNRVASNIFTSPEIASIGISEEDLAKNKVQADVYKLPLSTNPRAKMLEVKEGFVKIFARQGSGTIIGAVIVGPHASEMIFPLALALTHRLRVDDVSDTFTVYPSLSGSITEAARRLHKLHKG